MAGIGHLAVGAAAARLYGDGRRSRRVSLGAVACWALLSFLPDADVVGFTLGVRYGDPWGHRGATHSIAFSLAVGIAIGVAAALMRLPALRVGIAASPLGKPPFPPPPSHFRIPP